MKIYIVKRYEGDYLDQWDNSEWSEVVDTAFKTKNGALYYARYLLMHEYGRIAIGYNDDDKPQINEQEIRFDWDDGSDHWIRFEIQELNLED